MVYLSLNIILSGNVTVFLALIIVCWITMDTRTLLLLGNQQLSNNKLLLKRTLQGIQEGLGSLSSTQTMFMEINFL
jgi:hypothetical protein